MAGPYKVLEKVGNAWRLDLPESIQVYPIFSPDRLRKAATNPLPGQHTDPAPPIKVNGEDEWEVEKVLAVRLHRGRLQYRVQWIGYDPDPKWYPAQNLKNAPHRLRDFHTEYPNRPGPPRHLDYWLHCYENDEDAKDQDDDNFP